jgi:diaminopropionate ammonia-lyase
MIQMKNALDNPFRGTESFPMPAEIPAPSIRAYLAQVLLARCPAYEQTPLVHHSDAHSGAQFFFKDERNRMGLGSFKALGAAYVIAHLAQNQDVSKTTFVTASAGNHGLSVAAGAKVFGARAVVYLSNTVPDGFAKRLTDLGAQVVRAGDDYEASMQAALDAAQDHGWTLLSDSSWPGYTELPHRLMEGYQVLAAETVDQMPHPPTHIFLQAGVGGLAAAAASYFRHTWGDGPIITVVEPDAAPAIHHAIAAGKFVSTQGPVSSMGRLDCKEASLIALKGLARYADAFVLMSDDDVETQLRTLSEMGLATSPSGGAGCAAAFSNLVSFGPNDRVLCIISEGE